MNGLNCYSNFPGSARGWIVGTGFNKLCNSSTASGEGKPELYSSDFRISLFLAISYGLTASTKCKIYTNE